MSERVLFSAPFRLCGFSCPPPSDHQREPVCLMRLPETRTRSWVAAPSISCFPLPGPTLLPISGCRHYLLLPTQESTLSRSAVAIPIYSDLACWGILSSLYSFASSCLQPANRQSTYSLLELVLQSLLRPPVWYSVSPPTPSRPPIDRPRTRGGPRQSAQGHTTRYIPAHPSLPALALRARPHTRISPTAHCHTTSLPPQTRTGRLLPRLAAIGATTPDASLGID